MSEERVVSDFVWTPERGEGEPEFRSISWNNLLLSDELFGGKFLTSSEVRINPDTALQSTVLLACSRIISETVAGLPLLVYRRLKDGHEEVANDIPLAHVLGFAPNSWQTKFEFFEQLVQSVTLWGNSYTEIKSGRYGSVTELNNLHPSRMRVERLENGRLKYSYNDPQTGRLIPYTQDQVMHVRWTPEPDGVKGMMPVEIARDAIALARACEIYASKFWANMGRPGVVLQTDGSLSAETAERLRDNWERLHRGVQNAYKTAVLTNGLKVESFGATNTESQYLEVRKFQCEEITRVYRIPLHLVQGQSGGNLEVQGQEFVTYTLMPWLSRIEQSISRSLIVDDATYYAKFDVRGLLRGDSPTRASYYSTMMNLGVLSINDVRRAEGFGPLGKEADTHLVAMNLQPLEEAVKPKPDPSQMPGAGQGAPPKAPGVPPSLSGVTPGKAPMESPKGEVSEKKPEPPQAGGERSEMRELSPQDAELEEAQDEIAEEEGKWTKETSHYVYPNPFAGRGIKCANCTHYSGGGACDIVDGAIDSDAICKLWIIPQEKISQAPEKRAFCPTGEGGGIKNDCGKDGGDASPAKKYDADRRPGIDSLPDSIPADHKLLVNKKDFTPAKAPNSQFTKVPSDDQLRKGMNADDIAKIGAHRDLDKGTPVAFRIDIPTFNNTVDSGKPIYAVTVHEDSGRGSNSVGKPIGYDGIARLSGPVSFHAKEKNAAYVAGGVTSKSPIATVKGAFDPKRTVPKDIDSWTPVGYDPQKAAYFYDKRTGREVTGGTDAVSVGNTVFTREPKYGDRNAKKHYRSAGEMFAVDSWGIESRGFCPTGEGGGIDNSCGGDGTPGGDGSSSSGKPSSSKAAVQASPPPARSVTGRDVLKLLEKISQNPDGFTLDPASAEQPETGIMVSEFSNDSRRSVKIRASEITEDAGADAFVTWFDNNSDLLLGDGTKFVGGWKTGDDFYIDVATRFDPDKADQALEKGRQSGQLAVFNLGTFKETWVKYDENDSRKPKEWDSGFARARKDATSKQVYEDSTPAIQDEDWSAELTKHGKTTVRSYNGKPQEDAASERHPAFRHSVQANSHRDVSSVSWLSGEDDGQEAQSGLVQGQPRGASGTLQGSAASPEGQERRADDNCGRVEGGQFAPGNKCQEEGDGSTADATAVAGKSPASKSANIPLGNVRRQDVMLNGGKSVVVVDREATERAIQDRVSNPLPPGAPAGSTADLYDRTFVTREDPDRPTKITTLSPAFDQSDLAQNGAYVSHDAVGRFLTGRHQEDRAAIGGEGPTASFDTRSPLPPDQFEYVVDSLKRDVDRAYQDGRHPGFYSTDIAECMDTMSGFYPELKDPEEAKKLGTTPEDASFVFTMITAITSNGTNPSLNLESADAIYRLYREHGSVRTPDSLMGGERAKEIKRSLNRFQDMIDEFGEARVRRVLSGVTHASTIDATMRKLSRKSREIGGSWSEKGLGNSERKDEVVPVAAIFGPKIGSFFANLSGKHQFLTMDRWLMRSVGRVTGELLSRSTPEAANRQANAALAAIRARQRSKDVLFGVDSGPLGLKREDVVRSLELQARSGVIEESGAAYEWAKAAMRAYSKVPRGYTKDGKPYGSYGDHPDPQIRAAHKAGNTMFKSLLHEQQDPRSATARRVLREVFREVAKRVNEENKQGGGNVQVSEIQAVLWQYEQNLWKRIGANTKIEADSLYSAAATDLKSRRDRGEKLRVLAPERPNRPKSVRSLDKADDPVDFTQTDYPNQGGQDLWDGEVDTAEVDLVKLLAAIEGDSDNDPGDDGDVDPDGGPDKNSRAYCPTGEGGGVKNDCPPAGAGDSTTATASSPSSPGVRYGDRPQEIQGRLKDMGLDMDTAVSMAGGGQDMFIRKDMEKPQEGGIHVEVTRDVAGVKDGLFSTSVIRNVGTKDSPEIVVDHKVMEVSREVKASPEARHAAAREFFRIMTSSVESSMKAGVSKVVLNAAGNARGKTAWKGYTIWPRMGFDAPIPFHVRQKLPETLSHCNTLLDLHATKEGTKWWKDNGTDIDVQLDLKQTGSPQMQVFDKFVRRFMRDRREMAYGTGDGWLSPADQAKLDELWEEIWDDGLLDDYTGDEGDFSQVKEKRAYCPTGEGGGTDNSCSSHDSVDDSWRESEDGVDVWEKDDMQVRSPIKDGDKLRSFTVEDGPTLARHIDKLGIGLDDVVSIGTSMPKDADVSIGPYPGINQYTVVQEPAVVVSSSRDVAGIRGAAISGVTVHKQGDDLRVIYNIFTVSPEAQKKAPVACARELIGGVLSSIDRCQKHGVKDITLEAAGSASNPSFKGYRIWPKFGFDGVIPRNLLTRLREQDLSPRAVAEKRAGKLTVQALYETKAGQEYWEKHGAQIPMSLPLGDESSPGWNRYMKYRSKLGSLSEGRSLTPGDEIFTPDELKALDEIWDEIRKATASEGRAFCPTGDGGGVDNSCSGGAGGARILMSPDGGGSGGSSRWGGKTEKWGKSSETEIWTPGKPLFPGAERLASIKIARPNDVRGQLEDSLKMTIADAVLASGPLSSSVERAGITKPRLEITPGDYGGITMHWTSMGAATGEGFKGDEKEYAPEPGTAVKAAEASRDLRLKPSGDVVLHMGGFFIHPDFQGKGIAIDSVLHSTSAPVSRLEMEAERFDHPNPNTRLTGYSAWPRFGYDAPISSVIHVLSTRGVSLPPEYSKARTLTEVYSMPGGADFWKEHGGPITLTFDLRPRSRGRQILLELSDRKRKRSEGRNMASQVGTDSDFDPVLDEIWADIQSGKLKLTGNVPTQDEWDRWESDRKEAKDGDPGEVQPH